MLPPKHSSKKQLILITSIILYCCVYNISKFSSLRERKLIRYASSGEDEFVKGNCFIIDPPVYQWGNGVYYRMLSIIYLLKKEATYVKVSAEKGRKSIGVVNLDGVAYGPEASKDFDESVCTNVHPSEIWGGGWGNMWDFMNFREEFDSMSKEWPKGENLNQNPYATDFGVYPSMENVTNTIGVSWNEVLVLHIRQGDVMAQVNVMKKFVHSQPPCAYYEDAIETGYNGKPFPYVLIVTNKIKDRNANQTNPCDQYLEDRYSSGEHTTKLLNYNLVSNRLFTRDSHAGVVGENEDLRKDLFILTEAVNLAEGHSTFTIGTVMLNYKLKRHFYPSAPATINTVLPTKRTIDGLEVYTRQFYLPNVEQTSYILHGWLGFDGSCNAFNVHRDIHILQFMSKSRDKALQWKDTNFTEKLLGYDRSNIVKFKTINETFVCNSSSVTTDNPSWYIPCICDNAKE